MKKIIYLSLLLLFLLSSCASKKTVQYTIASKTVDCTGSFPQKCLLVKKPGASDWEYFYSNIQGFNYEEGYEYVIEVEEKAVNNPPADASSINYVLVKEISKESKTSDNLPPSMTTQNEEYKQCVGKVITIEKQDIGKGGAKGKFSAIVAKVQVTSSTIDNVNHGDIIHCELIAEPMVMPKEGSEYVFKAKNLHPAHAKGVYLLETNVLDLTQ